MAVRRKTAEGLRVAEGLTASSRAATSADLAESVIHPTQETQLPPTEGAASSHEESARTGSANAARPGRRPPTIDWER